MEKYHENIKTLIDNHLIGIVSEETSTQKEMYKITTENLVHFISSYFAMGRKGMEAIIKINKELVK